jgi:hypothetical protein
VVFAKRVRGEPLYSVKPPFFVDFVFDPVHIFRRFFHDVPLLVYYEGEEVVISTFSLTRREDTMALREWLCAEENR